MIGALNIKLLSLADCDADLRVVDVAAPAMQLEEGIADPAMQNADGVLVEAQPEGHGYVLGLQHEIGGGGCGAIGSLAVGSPAGFGLAAQLAAVGSAMAVSGLNFASGASGVNVV